MAIDINISTTFLGNTDTPNTYSGQGGKVVSVKNDATGLEFTTISLSDTNIYNTNGTLTANRVVTGGGFSLKFTGQSSFNIVSPNSNQASKGLTIRNAGDSDDLFNVRGNGEFQAKRTGDYRFEYFDYGNGFPALSLDAPSDGQIQQRFRHNGTNKVVFSINSSGDRFNINTNSNAVLEMRHNVDFVSNNIQVIKNILGEWLFTQDPTGTQNPEAGVRAKFVGTVKTVSPSVASSSVALAVRAFGDASNLFFIKGNGVINCPVMPTSSVGLATGDLWSDGGTIKIV